MFHLCISGNPWEGGTDAWGLASQGESRSPPTLTRLPWSSSCLGLPQAVGRRWPSRWRSSCLQMHLWERPWPFLGQFLACTSLPGPGQWLTRLLPCLPELPCLLSFFHMSTLRVGFSMAVAPLISTFTILAFSMVSINVIALSKVR